MKNLKHTHTHTHTDVFTASFDNWGSGGGGVTKVSFRGGIFECIYIY